MAGAQLRAASRFASSGSIASDSIELKGTARLLSTTLQAAVHRARALLAGAGGIVLPLRRRPAACCRGRRSRSRSPARSLGRYLFFVSVVPKHMAAPYLGVGSEAA